MKLYFIPFACSLATRIAIAEAELAADFIPVGKDKTLPDGRSFLTISPMGYVPALETRNGYVLTEGPAVLHYIADLAAEGVLAPAPYSEERYRMTAWLNFVSTELHKAVFHPLFSASDPAVKPNALEQAKKPLDLLAAHLGGRDYLVGERFTVADAYLLSVLNWCESAGVPIADWPVVLAWRTALRQRPSVAAAMAAERPLLKAA